MKLKISFTGRLIVTLASIVLSSRGGNEVVCINCLRSVVLGAAIKIIVRITALATTTTTTTTSLWLCRAEEPVAVPRRSRTGLPIQKIRTASRPAATVPPISLAAERSTLLRQLHSVLCNAFKFGCREEPRNQSLVQQPSRRALNAIFVANHLGLLHGCRGAAISQGSMQTREVNTRQRKSYQSSTVRGSFCRRSLIFSALLPSCSITAAQHETAPLALRLLESPSVRSLLLRQAGQGLRSGSALLQQRQRAGHSRRALQPPLREPADHLRTPRDEDAEPSAHGQLDEAAFDLVDIESRAGQRPCQLSTNVPRSTSWMPPDGEHSRRQRSPLGGGPVAGRIALRFIMEADSPLIPPCAADCSSLPPRSARLNAMKRETRRRFDGISQRRERIWNALGGTVWLRPGRKGR